MKHTLSKKNSIVLQTVRRVTSGGENQGNLYNIEEEHTANQSINCSGIQD